MPYSIQKGKNHGRVVYLVYNPRTHKYIGTHRTLESAQAQIRAIYASENK